MRKFCLIFLPEWPRTTLVPNPIKTVTKYPIAKSMNHNFFKIEIWINKRKMPSTIDIKMLQQSNINQDAKSKLLVVF